MRRVCTLCVLFVLCCACIYICVCCSLVRTSGSSGSFPLSVSLANGPGLVNLVLALQSASLLSQKCFATCVYVYACMCVCVCDDVTKEGCVCVWYVVYGMCMCMCM